MTDETMPETVETTAPVENVEQAPPEVETPTATPEAEPQQPDDAGEAPKPRGWVSARIKELSDDRNHWRELYLQSMQKAEAPNPPKSEPLKLPTLEEFKYDEAAYQAALIDYATKQAEQVVEKRLSEREAREAEMRRAMTFQERAAAFAKAAPDFEDVVLRDPTLPITPAMRDVIVDSDAGPEIAYWLATNREQAEKIAVLPPHLAALEMGRIEGRLAVQKEAARARPVPKVTQAPPPPPTVEASEPQVEKSPAEMSDAEFKKWRQRQIAQRR